MYDNPPKIDNERPYKASATEDEVINPWSVDTLPPLKLEAVLDSAAQEVANAVISLREWTDVYAEADRRRPRFKKTEVGSLVLSVHEEGTIKAYEFVSNRTDSNTQIPLLKIIYTPREEGRESSIIWIDFGTLKGNWEFTKNSSSSNWSLKKRKLAGKFTSFGEIPHLMKSIDYFGDKNSKTILHEEIEAGLRYEQLPKAQKRSVDLLENIFQKAVTAKEAKKNGDYYELQIGELKVQWNPSFGLGGIYGTGSEGMHDKKFSWQFKLEQNVWKLRMDTGDYPKFTRKERRLLARAFSL